MKRMISFLLALGMLLSTALPAYAETVPAPSEPVEIAVPAQMQETAQPAAAATEPAAAVPAPAAVDTTQYEQLPAPAPGDVVANSEHPSGGTTGDGYAKWAFDGKDNTWWHSNWSGNGQYGGVGYPYVLGWQVSSEPVKVAKIDYRGRTDQTTNMWNEIQIYGRTEGAIADAKKLAAAANTEQNKAAQAGNQVEGWTLLYSKKAIPHGAENGPVDILLDKVEPVTQLAVVIFDQRSVGGNPDTRHIATSEIHAYKVAEPMPEVDPSELTETMALPQNKSVNAAASSQQASGADGPAAQAFDGSLANGWHSEYNTVPGVNGASDHWISWDLAGGPYYVRKIEYTRKNNGNNGAWKTVNVYAKDEAGEWQPVLTGYDMGDTNSDGAKSDIVFPEMVKTTGLRVEILDAYGNRQGDKAKHANAGEIRTFVACTADQLPQGEEGFYQVTDPAEITADGLYGIVNPDSKGYHILYHAGNGANTDQVDVQVADGKLTLNPNGNFQDGKQNWKLLPQADGTYVLEAANGDAGHKYLNMNEATAVGSKVPVTGTAQNFNLEPAECGFRISRTLDGGKKLYLNHDQNGAKQHNVTENDGSVFYLYKKGRASAIDKSALQTELARANALVMDKFAEAGKPELAAAVAEAQRVLSSQTATTPEILAAAAVLRSAMQKLQPNETEIAAGRPEAVTVNGTPFQSGVTGGAESQQFRIPNLITLQNGHLAAAIDARWNHKGDHGNIDNLFSISEDGGKTWTTSFANFFNDSTNVQNDNAASFMDPVTVQAADGTIYMMATMYPGGSALHGASPRSVQAATGYVEIDKVQRMVLYTHRGYNRAKTSGAAQTNSNYSYYVGDFAKAEGDTKAYAPVIAKGDAEKKAAYYMDEWFYLYNADKTPMYCRQLGSDKYVQQNVFFHNADLHVREASYLYLTSTADEGKTWSAPKILNPQVRTGANLDLFYGVGPGAGLSFVDASGLNVLVLPCYTHPTERSSFIYSYDKGETWHRAANATDDHSSESIVIQLDATTARQFYRDTVTSNLRYTDYTWDPAAKTFTKAGAPVEVAGVTKTTGNQLSAVVYPEKIGGRQAILVSTAGGPGSTRANGRIYLLLVQDDKSLVKFSEYSIQNPDPATNNFYGYSSIAVLQDGSVGLIAEQRDPFIDAAGETKYYACPYMNLPMADILAGAAVNAQAVSQRSLLGDKIELQVLYQFSDALLLCDPVRVEFTVGEGAKQLKQTVVIDENTKTVPNGGDTLYAVPCLLPAKNQADKITAKVFVGKDTLISTTQDLSFVGYADSLLKNQDQAKVHDLVKSILYYGEKAQMYFDYNLNKLATEGQDMTAIAEEARAVTAASFDALPKDDEVDFAPLGDLTCYGATLMLKDQVGIRVYFDLAAGNIADYSFTVNGVPVQPVEKNLGTEDQPMIRYYVQISGIKPNSMDRLYQVEVTHGEEKSAINYGAVTYMKNMIRRSEILPGHTNMELVELLRAMRVYNLKADAYTQK